MSDRLRRKAFVLLCCALAAVSSAWNAAVAQATPGAPAAPVPATPRADLGPVNALVRAGSYAEAESALAELQQQFPDDPRILFMRGELLLALARPADALPLLQRCVELEPERARLQFQLGTALQATGDRAGAIEAFGREIERTADPQIKVLGHLNRSLLFEQDKNWEAATTEVRAVLALEPTRLEAYGDLATLYLAAGRLDEARASLETGLAAGFRSAGHFYSLGSQYLKAQAYEPAAAAFRSALEIDPQHAESVRNLAVALDQLGQGEEAAGLFRRYLELRPDAPDASRIRKELAAKKGA